MMKKSIWMTIAPLLFSFTVAAMAQRDAPAAETEQKPAVEITMTDDLAFEPAKAEIVVGEVVEWRNASGVMHTVTADTDKAANPRNVRLPEGAEPFDSGEINPGETFRKQFDVPGRYRYFCAPHETAGMTGEILVIAGA